MSHTKKSLMKTTFTPRSHELEHIKPWSLQNFLNHSNMNTLFCVFMCFIVSISTASQIRNRFKYSLIYSCSLTIDYVVWTVCTPWVMKGLAAVGWDYPYKISQNHRSASVHHLLHSALHWTAKLFHLTLAFWGNGFKKFQKIYDLICPIAWFLGVNLSSVNMNHSLACAVRWSIQ